MKIILEERDVATRKAISRLILPPFIEVLVVPSGKPQTKPRALNYALHFARGELLTIYDAEDVPDPLQLRRAAAAFAKASPKIACVQAELAFHNSNENWLSRQFAVEYAVQFRMVLPALARHRLPLPLGGTSNHFRTAVLRQVCGWDSYNVTEDADIGMRLARAGFRTGVLQSVTIEEANIQYSNWLAQRSRWLKGFMQTWLVHMRNPRALRRQCGWLGFLAIQSTLLGVFLSSLMHPIFLAVMGWQIWNGSVLNPGAGSPWFELSGFYLALLAGNYFVMMVSGWLASKGLAISGKILVIATMPVYWLLTSLAGWMALWQLITRPFHWNKTQHGLSKMDKAGTKTSLAAVRPSASPA